MMARWLRICLAGEVIAVALAAAFLTGVCGLRALAAVGGAIGGSFAAGFASFLWRYALTRKHAWKAPRSLRVGILRGVSSVVIEYFAFLALFSVIQPFDRLWMGEDRARPPGRERAQVLLVHGYLCNRGAWWWLRGKLRSAGFDVVTVTLEPPLADLDRLTLALSRRVEELCAGSGRGKIALVGHSMGGLVCLSYLRRFGPDRVRRLVTLATPYHGTRAARLSFGPNGREMRPGSKWLRELAAYSPAVPALTIWSTHDSLVVPQDSARLSGAREIVLTALGHVAMLFSLAVLRHIEGELREPGRSEGAAPSSVTAV